MLGTSNMPERQSWRRAPFGNANQDQEETPVGRAWEIDTGTRDEDGQVPANGPRFDRDDLDLSG